MTAYGRAVFEAPFGRVSIEIQSINRRHLDIVVFIPKELAGLDNDLRKWISGVIARGQVTLRVSIDFNEEGGATVFPNIALAKKLKTAWDKLTEALHLINDEKILLSLIAQKSDDLFVYDQSAHDLAAYKEALQKATHAALQQVMQMKIAEGEFLLKDILERVKQMHALIAKIETRAINVSAQYLQKLKERLEMLLPQSIESDDRILREALLFAEKVDITEEIIRFHSHLDQLSLMLASTEKAVAKTIEFLLQELLREANTISSKSPDAEITHYSVTIKSELEKIREQIQNVE